MRQRIILLFSLGGALLLLLFIPTLQRVYGKIMGIYGSVAGFEEFIAGFGWWAPLTFFLLQVLQVIISPIPGNVTSFAGGALFGFGTGFFLSAVAILCGSLIAFFLVRIFGRPLLHRFVEEATIAKYNKVFTGKKLIFLFLLFLFPFFPDDALCFMAGFSNLPTILFMLMILLGRLPGILVASLLGAGLDYIVLSPWLILLLGTLVLLVIGVWLKYARQIEDWITDRFGLDS
ncbi:MAG: TVP38/TMEM64 family protein [Firmicutes bacterium]|nr:TVP38/TMEM64 family protein [Bacillota bacterium]